MTERIQLADSEGTVTVRKLVSKGARLEIDRGDASVKLDALLLEGLAWQDHGGAVDDVLESEGAVATDPVAFTAEQAVDDLPEQPVDAISISNEYAQVYVRSVATAGGDAVEVTTPGRGTAVTLGLQSLRALAGVTDTDVFSIWFKKPFGPEDTPVEGPL
jgi:hypothetical protein